MKPSELQRAVALLESGDWKAAHQIVQRDEESRLACWAHGIVHRMEGDTGNARYWYRQAKRPFHGDRSVAQEIHDLKEELSRK